MEFHCNPVGIGGSLLLTQRWKLNPENTAAAGVDLAGYRGGRRFAFKLKDRIVRHLRNFWCWEFAEK